MTTLLVDADGPLFMAAAAVQTSVLWDDDLATTWADLDEAKDAFTGLLLSYQKATDDDAQIVLCFSCPTRRYFRHDILPTYKSNRRGDPPLVLRPLREWAAEAWESKTKPGLEADDVVGILATSGRYKTPIIVSADKDLGQIPGLHLDARDPEAGEYRVSDASARRLLWLQTLTGDAVDGYSGLPGYGPVKAGRLLDKAEDWPLAVLEAYRKAGLTDEDCAAQHNVARILTRDTYNFREGRPILWQPQTLTPPSPNAVSATATSPATRRSRKTSKT